MRGWRNRQTRWIQVPVPARAWGFNSPLAHRGDGPIVIITVGPSPFPRSVVRCDESLRWWDGAARVRPVRRKPSSAVIEGGDQQSEKRDRRAHRDHRQGHRDDGARQGGAQGRQESEVVGAVGAR